MGVLLLLLFTLVAADHPGAYSSPQYAKKMYPKNFDSNLLPQESQRVTFQRDTHPTASDRYDSANDTYNDTYGSSSFLDTASSFLTGAGGQVMSSLAKDFIARSTGSSQVGFDCVSQVLSLNLTNLVILIVLKALILAAGFFGAGAWKGHNYARSLDDNKNASYITEDELLLYLSYLAGQARQDYSCLYRLSCERPRQAGLYSAGGELVLQGVKLLQGNSIELESYEDISNGVKQAAAWGQDGRPCDKRYRCGD